MGTVLPSFFFLEKLTNLNSGHQVNGSVTTSRKTGEPSLCNSSVITRKYLLTLPHSNRVEHDDGYWKAVWRFQYLQNGEPQHASFHTFLIQSPPLLHKNYGITPYSKDNDDRSQFRILNQVNLLIFYKEIVLAIMNSFRCLGNRGSE